MSKRVKKEKAGAPIAESRESLIHKLRHSLDLLFHIEIKIGSQWPSLAIGFMGAFLVVSPLDWQMKFSGGFARIGGKLAGGSIRWLFIYAGWINPISIFWRHK